MSSPEEVGALLFGMIAIASLSYCFYQAPNGDRSLELDSNFTIERNPQSSSNKAESVLNTVKFSSYILIAVEEISHDTKLFRFEIPGGGSLGLPVGRHVSVRADIEGNAVVRAYTPTSRPDQRGYFELLVKRYEFGKMSRHLHSLRVGQALQVRGPVGRFHFTKNKFGTMGFIAGGTGLTPCLQVLRCVLEGPEGAGDGTKFVLLYQNRTEEDILLRDELDHLAQQHASRLAVHYFLSSPSEEWLSQQDQQPQIRGAIHKAAIARYMPFAECKFVGLCGPAGLISAMKKLLLEVGHPEESVFLW